MNVRIQVCDPVIIENILDNMMRCMSCYVFFLNCFGIPGNTCLISLLSLYNFNNILFVHKWTPIYALARFKSSNVLGHVTNPQRHAKKTESITSSIITNYRNCNRNKNYSLYSFSVLAHVSWKFKWGFLITFCLLPVCP